MGKREKFIWNAQGNLLHFAMKTKNKSKNKDLSVIILIFDTWLLFNFKIFLIFVLVGFENLL